MSLRLAATVRVEEDPGFLHLRCVACGGRDRWVMPVQQVTARSFLVRFSARHQECLCARARCSAESERWLARALQQAGLT